MFPSLLMHPIAFLRTRVFLVVPFLLTMAAPAMAQLDLAQRPIYAGGNIPPQVMIDLSKDHQLYFKAYNDYSDLDGDGNLETTYAHSIDYYGYFDSYKCYNYDTSTNRFVPASITENKYCSGNWSGNFLNWVAMSRMDAVRKLLYGGLRSTDEPATVTTRSGRTDVTRDGITVLERSFQPTDAHAWAKFYDGADLTRLTPATSVGSGLTFCNMTPGSSSGDNKYSQTNTNAPQIRVVTGNYALWASNERWQCTWSEEHSASNANNSASSGIFAADSNPKRADKGFGTGSGKGEYTARVQVCVPNLIGREKCQQYPNLNYKPIGLLQTYGEKGQMKFGLMTGSYTKNISGGVLRRNIADFSSEINVSTNGTFKLGSNAAAGEVKGIVHNLNRMRIYGYNYDGGGYTEVSSDSESCNYQMTGMVLTGGGTGQGDAAPQGNCSSWGNPISEIFLESIRYFAGLQPTDAFKYTSSTNGTKDDKLGLTIEAWQDPLTATNYCSPLNTLVFNPAVSSYDGDQMNMSGIGDASSTTAATWTDKVGVDETVTSGSKWLVGSNGTTDNGSCTAKELTGLSGALGICPEAPTQKGTYLMAGAAYYAKTNRIRTSGAVAEAVPASDTRSLKVTTYGIQLASNTPSITINVNGHPVKIIPSYRVNAGGKGVYASGTLVDFKVVQQDATSGKFYVNWEDSNQGGDFDQDVWGILSYEISGDQIKVTTNAITTASANGQGFGYVISGTDKDGAHFHSGAYGFNYTDPTGVTGCTNCRAGNESGGQRGATTVTYTATGDSGGQLQDPLWYAAKWGGFNGTSGKPDDPAKWDTRRADGSPGSDGVPDNYFFVANPGALETALERAFISILTTSSSSSVATNSSSLQNGSRIYQARFNAIDWSGQLLALPIDLDGVIADVPEWDAAQKMPAHGSRVIVTYDNNPDSNSAGIPFRWGETFPYKEALQAEGEANLTKAEQRLAWLRGDQSQEGNGPAQLRRRSSILGDLVNSNPQFVGKPASGYDDSHYFTFANTYKDREPMLYVGGNDGMLHGFSALDGVEKLAYVPSSVVPNLKELTGQSYAHLYYVDGTPTIADVKVDASTWKTLLIGGLNAGGKGFYALDVTDTESFSEANAGSIVQWEFTNANDANLGYTFGRPSVVKMANGRWAAVFGNGYNSSTGKAALFIVFLDRTAGSKSWVIGTDYIRIDLAGIAESSVNGLSSPTIIDDNVDGVADYIYAGDLLGNMWKFDVRSANASLWKVAYGTSEMAQPLYSARSAAGTVQPITSGPEIMRNPAGGFVVLFGTGRYLEAGDARTTATQTFYGIWDQNGSTTPVIDRGSLVQQSIIAELTVENIDYRLTSDERVVYGDVSPRARGWYMDLSESERVIYNPVVRSGRLIFTTIIPSENVCTSGGGSWLMELDGVTGSALDYSPLDVNGDGKIDNADIQMLANGDSRAVGGRKLNGLAPFPTIIGGKEDDREIKVTGSEVILEKSSSSSGRLSWREIMQ